MNLDDLNLRLQQALIFNAEDLAANQREELSRTQLARLRGSRSIVKWATLIVGLLFALGVPLLIYVISRNSGASSNPTDALWPALIAGGVGFTLFALSMLYYFWQSRDQRAARISMTQGIAQPVAGGEYEYKVRIGEKTLRVGLALMAKAFAPGVPYRVYHLPQGPMAWVLSAEALPEPAPAESRVFVARNVADLDKSDPEAERGSISDTKKVALGVMFALVIMVIGIPLALVFTNNMSPLVSGLVYLVVFAIAIAFPFVVIGQMRRAMPEAAAHLAEAAQAASDMMDEKLEDADV